MKTFILVKNKTKKQENNKLNLNKAVEHMSKHVKHMELKQSLTLLA